jgi:hypothetical protein
MGAGTSRKREAIEKWAGGKLYAKEVDDEGTDLSPTPDTYTDLGYVKVSKLMDVTEEEDIADETGNIVITKPLERIPKYEVTFMQSDKALLDFLKEGVRKRYWAIYHYQGVIDDNYQEIFIGIATIQARIELEAGVKELPTVITMKLNESAIVQLNANLPAIKKTAGDVTIPAEEYYTIVETPV